MTPKVYRRRLADLVPDANANDGREREREIPFYDDSFLIHCGVKMEGGYRLGEFVCPECGLIWNSATNTPLEFDPTDTGAFKFYS